MFRRVFCFVLLCVAVGVLLFVCLSVWFDVFVLYAVFAFFLLFSVLSCLLPVIVVLC